MSNSLSRSRLNSASGNPPGPFPLLLRSGALVVAAALLCVPPLAAVAKEAGRSEAASAPQAGTGWISGGVGDESREEMRKVAAAYDLHLVFSDQRGAYLAEIPFTVTRLAPGKRQEIISAVSDGPLLYLKLPPGTYEVAARIDGTWQTQRIQAGAAGSSRRLSFVSRAH